MKKTFKTHTLERRNENGSMVDTMLVWFDEEEESWMLETYWPKHENPRPVEKITMAELRFLVDRAVENGEEIDKEAIEKDISESAEFLTKRKEYYSKNPIVWWCRKFHFCDKSELEEAIKHAYQLGLSPLRNLREALKEVGGDKIWEVRYWSGWEGYGMIDFGLVVVRVIYDENNVVEEVEIEVGE